MMSNYAKNRMNFLVYFLHNINWGTIDFFIHPVYHHYFHFHKNA